MTVQELIERLEGVPNKSIPVVIEDTDYQSGWTCHELKSIVETEQVFIHRYNLGEYRCLLLKCGINE